MTDRIYIGCSAALKLLLTEPESAALRRYLTEAGPELFSSDLLSTEVLRRGTAAGVPIAAMRQLLSGIRKLRLSTPLMERAGLLPAAPGTFVRSLDAVHIAAAHELGLTQFLTYDSNQRAAAIAAGFDVIVPA